MESGIGLSGHELDVFNFMSKRAEAFEKNELDPDALKKIVEDLKSNRSTTKKR